jgi:hypothetical protein
VKSRYFLNWLLEKTFQRFLDCQFPLKKLINFLKSLPWQPIFKLVMPIRQSRDVGQGGESVEQQEAVVVVVLSGVQVEEEQRNKMLKKIIIKLFNLII